MSISCGGDVTGFDGGRRDTERTTPGTAPSYGASKVGLCKGRALQILSAAGVIVAGFDPRRLTVGADVTFSRQYPALSAPAQILQKMRMEWVAPRLVVKPSTKHT